MKNIFFFQLIIGSLIFSNSSILAQSGNKEFSDYIATVEEIEIDSVIADFPVSFAMVTSAGWQFVAYYNKSRELSVASRKLTSKLWNYAILPTRVGWDSHNYISIAIDKDNCVHVSGNMHADSMLYFKTTRPFDITSFQKIFPLVSSEDELKCTYPQFLKNSANELVFFYRKGGSGNGNTIFLKYDEKSRSFSKLFTKPLFDGLEQMSAYMEGPILGPDGYYHMVWVWRDTPDCETNHDWSYARSKDLIFWEALGSAQNQLPITPLSVHYTVDPVPPKGGSLNGVVKLFFNGSHKAHLVYMKYDSLGNSQLFIARPEQNKWHIRQLSDWTYRWDFSGPGSIDNHIRLTSASFKSPNRISVKYWHIKKGFGELIIDSAFRVLSDSIITESEHSEYPSQLLKPQSTYKGMSVKWVRGFVENNSFDFYGLRWETTGIRRYYDKPLEKAPPSILKLYRFQKLPSKK